MFALLSGILIGCADLSTPVETVEVPAEVSQPESFPVRTGAERLAGALFDALDGRRVGLIANHTSLVGDRHLSDIMSSSDSVQLVALFGPEHGIRGDADAGATIQDGRDLATGVPIYSLYGENRRPTRAMLEDVEALVFDIQDVGARFYTFISTMGLSMQSAAEAGIPFFVLDRPNPLGGKEIEGFVLDQEFSSFVGQYPIPVRHGLTIGELAHMIQGERWLPGLDSLDLRVIRMANWTRDMLWTDTQLPWIPTSPNIPTFESALMYPGTCFFEATSASEGRGTLLPFLTFGAPWMDAQTVSAQPLPGLVLTPGRITPVGIPGKSANPKWKDQSIESVTIQIVDNQALRPVSAGLELISRTYQGATEEARSTLLNERWMSLLGGTDRIPEMIRNGYGSADFQAAWEAELARFDALRQPYLMYQ